MLPPSLGLLLRFWENVKQNVFTFCTSLEDVKNSGDITSRMCSTRISKTSPFSASDLKLANGVYLLIFREDFIVYKTFMMELFSKAVITFKLLTIFAKKAHQRCLTVSEINANKFQSQRFSVNSVSFIFFPPKIKGRGSHLQVFFKKGFQRKPTQNS